MPGDPLKHVQVGQRLEIPAAAYNAFADAAKFARGRLHEADHKKVAALRQAGIVKVKNASGVDQERFAILGLTEPIILPSDSIDEFKRQVAFNGVVPVKNDHRGKFAVLLEPIGEGKIGLAVISGVVPVRLKVDPDQFYDRAEIIDADTGKLLNVPHGSARVLWIDAIGSVERWAIVRLDDGDYQAHVLITSNVPDDDGYYPGEVQRYDVDTKSWQTLFECKVMDINQ